MQKLRLRTVGGGGQRLRGRGVELGVGKIDPLVFVLSSGSTKAAYHESAVNSFQSIFAEPVKTEGEKWEHIVNTKRRKKKNPSSPKHPLSHRRKVQRNLERRALSCFFFLRPLSQP